jgi:penicillin-binding protein A
MNRSITRVATFLLVLFGALFVNLNVITLIQADDLANHPANRRLIVREYELPRGPIVVGEEAVASSVPSDGELRYLRTYPEGSRYAHLTGYYSLVLQRSGLEQNLNEQLTGRPTEVVAQNLGDLLGGANRPGNAVHLTIDGEVQAAAEAALDGREGAIVVLDPLSGAVLASYANPTFDPNPLSSHDRTEIRDAWDELREAENQPLLNRATSETYPPGSAFKLIVAAAALERGAAPDTLFPDDEDVYDVPQTQADIGNYGGGTCISDDEITLSDAMRVSCNTVFARLGVDLGDEELIRQAERFGFNRDLPYDLSTATSFIPQEMDVPSTAQSAIGQRDVRATPIHMAVIAASIANGGELLRPYLVANVVSPDGQVVQGPDDGPWTGAGGDARPVSARTAEQLRQMMIEVVESGTGTAAAIDGVEVGGKTGTAQASSGSVVWFVGFAGDDAAIAVVLPTDDEGATGGGVAAPLARDVLQVAVDRAG